MSKHKEVSKQHFHGISSVQNTCINVYFSSFYYEFEVNSVFRPK